MSDQEKVVMASAEMQNNGIIVNFSDGKLAFYSAALLRSIFDRAEELHGTAEDTEEDRKGLRPR